MRSSDGGGRWGGERWERRDRAPEGQAARRTKGPLDGLTTGPQIHRLPVRVLPQHFWGEVSGCSCEPCSPDTQTGRHTQRGWQVSNPEQDPAGRGMRLPWRWGKWPLPPEPAKGWEPWPGMIPTTLDQGGRGRSIPVTTHPQHREPHGRVIDPSQGPASESQTSSTTLLATTTNQLLVALEVKCPCLSGPG